MKRVESLTKQQLVDIVNKLYTKDGNKDIINEYLTDGRVTDDEIIKLHLDGLSASQISKDTGLSVQLIMYKLKKYGVYTPSKKGRKQRNKEIQ